MKRGVLDLKKYGLSHLKNQPVETWTDTEYESILDAFANEDIAPNVDLSYTLENVEEILSKSYCRKCAKCCQIDPRKPDHPGVMVKENELKIIGKHSSFSYK